MPTPIAAPGPTRSEADNIAMSIVQATSPPWVVDKVGMEFEGGWNNAERDIMTDSARWRTVGDASVRVTAQWYVGEIVTVPLPTWAEVVKAIEDGYPPSVNESCGFHVHCSFPTKADYSRLTDPAFWEYFVTYWRAIEKAPPAEWSAVDVERFKRRWTGGSSFTGTAFHPGAQMYHKTKGGPRYSHLNYCYGVHGTLECRLLPMFTTKKGAIKAVELLLACYHGYLSQPEVKVDHLEAMAPLEVGIVTVEHLADVAIKKTIKSETYEIEMVAFAETINESMVADIHPDFLRRAPAGTFKMLEVGTQEPRQVRERVKALLRKFAEEETPEAPGEET